MSDPDPNSSNGTCEALAAALSCVVIHSPVSFAFGGGPLIDVRTVQPIMGWTNIAPSGAGSTDDLLVKAIQAMLYDRCYARRTGEFSPSAHDPAVDSEFARRLVAANAGREKWDKGWAVHQFGPNGQVFVRKADRERIAVPGAFILDGMPGLPPQIGAVVSIHVPHDTFAVQPGYYYVFGETLNELADQLNLVRLYFNCTAHNAPSLVAALTGSLNRFQTPFQLKTPSSPALYGRTDTAVLYVGARYFPIVARIVMSVIETVPLEPSTPLFTKTLWPGVGAAVEPGSGESFGAHRCRLTAEAIVDAWRQGAQDVHSRRDALAACFAGSGLDLDRPWLGPGGVDLFEKPQPAKLP